MSFVHPWAPAAGCAGALLVLILWLLRRYLLPEMEFPPFVWLKEARRNRTFLTRLRNRSHVLFAVVTALLLGVVFGRPIWGGRFGGLRTVVIVLDASLSMSSVFADAKEKAGEIIEGLSEREEANLAVAGSAVSWAYERAASGLRKGPLWAELRRAEAGSSAGSLKTAVKQALSKLGSKRTPERLLYVISDFQKNSWLEVPSPPFEGVTVKAVRVGKASKDNIALSLPNGASFFSFVNEPLLVPLEVRNFGSKPKVVELRWEIEGNTVKRDSCRVPPEGKTVIRERLSFSEHGVFQGFCQAVAGDTLSGDNLVYFSVEVKNRCTVGLLCEEPEVEKLLSNALSGASGRPVSTKSLKTAGGDTLLHSKELLGCSALIATSGAPAGARQELGSGPAAILFEVTLKNLPEKLAGAGKVETGEFVLQSNFEGSSVRGIPSLSRVVVERRITGLSGTGTLLRFSDGQPAVLQMPERNITVCLFGLKRGESDLLFNEENAEAPVVFLGELLRVALGNRYPSLFAGRKDVLWLKQLSYRFFAPSGQELFPEAVPAGFWTKLSLPPFKECGYLRVLNKGRPVMSLPVNVPPQEPDPEVAGSVLENWKQAGGRVQYSKGYEFTHWVLVLLFLFELAWLFITLRGKDYGRV